jgi:GxxExxY protein
MKLNDDKVLHKELSYKIIGLAMKIHNELGGGFLEKVYENAMIVLLNKEGIVAKQQVSTPIYFEGQLIGDYYADIIVEDKIILELKAVECITDVHRAQALNYLKATKLKLAIIVNFSRPKLQMERVVL